jgi:hypothetical protein
VDLEKALTTMNPELGQNGKMLFVFGDFFFHHPNVLGLCSGDLLEPIRSLK